MLSKKFIFVIEDVMSGQLEKYLYGKLDGNNGWVQSVWEFVSRSDIYYRKVVVDAYFVYAEDDIWTEIAELIDNIYYNEKRDYYVEYGLKPDIVDDLFNNTPIRVYYKREF